MTTESTEGLAAFPTSGFEIGFTLASQKYTVRIASTAGIAAELTTDGAKNETYVTKFSFVPLGHTGLRLVNHKYHGLDLFLSFKITNTPNFTEGAVICTGVGTNWQATAFHVVDTFHKDTFNRPLFNFIVPGSPGTPGTSLYLYAKEGTEEGKYTLELVEEAVAKGNQDNARFSITRTPV
ncbi:hypothetical protein ONZ45_g9053 [Pleurotus djamor]|nr:hypothetical protein ONZ45_g9053 [Pleurotus djamor]